jgi:hypothetical protein
MQWARKNPSESGVSSKVSNDFIHATPPTERSLWSKKRKGTKYKRAAKAMR